jgi:PAS domain S-box-containing protein
MAKSSHARILVVDDTEASRYAVSRILRQAAYTVQEASTGREALELAAGRPDLVILDVNLPDASGYDICRQLKAGPTTAAIPVMHLSASFVESEDRSEGLESGADGYLTYPLAPRELLANVQALLRIRKAEQALRSQTELLRVTLSSIGDGVIATDPAGLITFINPVARALTGWGEEAVHRPLPEVFRIIDEETAQPVESPVEQVIRTGQVVGLGNHSVLIARDGARRPIDDSAAPIRAEEGEVVGVVLVFRDVTERRRLEDEVRLRSEELVQRDQRKDEFLAMLGHELRNPLAPISNSLHLLRLQLAGDPRFEQPGRLLERQVVHLTRLVDDLMDVSRITRGKLDLQKQRVALATIMTQAAEATRPFLEERDHRLEVVQPAAPAPLEADPARLEQVLSNLLNNAAKYTPPGGLVRLAGAVEGGQAVVRVRDNGIGIRPEMLPRLFEMFQQADRVPGRVSEGLGLGLSLVRSLVEMHGGSVSAHSAGAGQGSEFVVRLPLAPGSPTPEPPTTTVAAPSEVRPLRILIVDDNVDGANSLALLLRLEGHEVKVVHDGQAALEAAGEFRPEAVLLDIGLPRGMDGYEVAIRLRALPGLGSVLIVALTGYGQEEDRQRSSAAGFSAHLVKPVNLDLLREALARAGAR